MTIKSTAAVAFAVASGIDDPNHWGKYQPTIYGALRPVMLESFAEDAYRWAKLWGAQW